MNNKIQIKNLYKIFGDKADQALKLVQGGLSKTELLEKHGHVLGL
jgi:glycine betaine/proline transport system ATP-binding protein